MIFRRGKKNSTDTGIDSPEAAIDQPAETEAPTSANSAEASVEVGGPDAGPLADAAPQDDGTEAAVAAEDALDLAALDALDWRDSGPWDISEVDLESEEEDPEHPRIDLGSMVVTGFPGAELRLQMAEETQQIVSAMLISDDSAIELGAYAAPRSGGLWSELRDDIIQTTAEMGGSATVVEGPFGVELRRLLPVTTPEGQQGYQPSRMWVAEGPRWLLRGIIYGQAALTDGSEPPVAELLDVFRSVVVRRGDQAMAPGDLLALRLPENVSLQDDPAGA